MVGYELVAEVDGVEVLARREGPPSSRLALGQQERLRPSDVAPVTPSKAPGRFFVVGSPSVEVVS